MGTTIRDNPKMLSNQRLELVTTFFSLTKERESSLTNLTSAAYLSLPHALCALAALRSERGAARSGFRLALRERPSIIHSFTYEALRYLGIV